MKLRARLFLVAVSAAAFQWRALHGFLSTVPRQLVRPTSGTTRPFFLLPESPVVFQQQNNSKKTKNSNTTGSTHRILSADGNGAE